MLFEKIFLKTRWHTIFSAVFQLFLKDTGVTVGIEFPLSMNPVKADIVLLRNPDHRKWTHEQIQRLPDGIRDCKASHILVEFKKTESINDRSFLQSLMYDTLYQGMYDLKRNQWQTFLVSSKTPNHRKLEAWGYQETKTIGVYRSSNIAAQHIIFIDLNRLANTAYNAPYKCFASRKSEYQKAFRQIDKIKDHLPEGLLLILSGLRRLLNLFWKEEDMQKLQTEELEQKFLVEQGRKLVEALSAKERLRGLPPEVVLQHYSIKDRLEGLSPKDRLEGLSPEDRLGDLSPEDRLEGLSKEAIENYLASLEQKQS